MKWAPGDKGKDLNTGESSSRTGLHSQLPHVRKGYNKEDESPVNDVASNCWDNLTVVTKAEKDYLAQ